MRWIVFLLVITGCAGTQEEGITVAAASSLRPALDDVAAAFSAETGTDVEIIYASSGKLSAQIQAGAAYDAFLSADDLYPYELATTGFATPPRTYAHGQLALWTTLGAPVVSDSLLSDRIRKIALPNPKVAPYGRAAIAYLEARGLRERLADKLVFGESVGQANQFVYAGAAEVGFTAVATVLRIGENSAYQVLADAPGINQQGVVVSATQRRETAEAFMAFLLGPDGQAILVRNGYLGG